MTRSARSHARVPGAVPAVVVGIENFVGLQTSRILAARGIPIVGVGSDPTAPFCRSRVFSRKVFASTSDEGLIDALAELGPTLGGRSPLFMSADDSVLLVSRARSRLEPWYHIALPDDATVRMLTDKASFARFAGAHGFPIPRTVLIETVAGAAAAADSLRFPLLLKPAIRAEYWGKHTRQKGIKVTTAAELRETLLRVLPWGGSVIAQEWIPGPESNLYSCNAYFGVSGEPLVSFVARKLRQWPPEVGRSSLGEECRNDEVRDTSFRLFQTAGFRGPAYLEMKCDERDGRHWIVEPNVGRATGRSAIAEAGGVELLLTQYCDALGLRLPDERQQRYAGAKWIYLRWDLQASLVGIARGDLTPAAWWRSLRGPKFHAVWSRHDPMPFVADCWAPIAHRIRRLLRRSKTAEQPIGQERAHA